MSPEKGMYLIAAVEVALGDGIRAKAKADVGMLKLTGTEKRHTRLCRLSDRRLGDPVGNASFKVSRFSTS